MELRICEIYRSIQGETSRVGLPATLIRLAGCNLSCRWCDTPEAAGRAETLTVPEILRRAGELAGLTAASDGGHFLVTGGEPLLQPAVPELLGGLLATGREVLLETNGSLPIAGIDRRVVRILDLKAPGSGMVERIHWENVAELTPRDEVKLVLADRADYEWARRTLADHRLAERCLVLLSPAHGLLDPRELVAWTLADRLPVRVQLQLHKQIWGATSRGV